MKTSLIISSNSVKALTKKVESFKSTKGKGITGFCSICQTKDCVLLLNKSGTLKQGFTTMILLKKRNSQNTLSKLNRYSKVKECSEIINLSL